MKSMYKTADIPIILTLLFGLTLLTLMPSIDAVELLGEESTSTVSTRRVRHSEMDEENTNLMTS